MPSVLTHLFLADKAHDKYCSFKNKQELLIGSVFPDIRKLNILKRHQTHTTKVEQQALKSASAFYTGYYHHNILDIALRQDPIVTEYLQKFINEFNITWYYAYTGLTLYIDKLILDNFKVPIVKYKKAFKNILNEEINFDKKLTKSHLQKWHTLIIEFLTILPKDINSAQVLLQQWNTSNTNKFATEILRAFKEFDKQNKQVQKYFQNFYTQVNCNLLENKTWQKCNTNKT